MFTIYGLYVSHPADVIQDTWRNSLPDITGQPVRYFSDMNGISQAIRDCSKGEWTFHETFGSKPQQLSIGSVGVVYKVPVSEQLMQYINEQRMHTRNSAYLFSATLPADKIYDITVVLPEDVLHAQETVMLTDAAPCLEQRKSRMTMLDSLLHRSSQLQRDTFNPDTAQESLRFLFGNNGLLTSEDIPLQYVTLQDILYNVLAAKDANIAYAIHASEYREIIDGIADIQLLPQLRAIQQVLTVMADIADEQGDFKTRSTLYSLQKKVQQSIKQAETK